MSQILFTHSYFLRYDPKQWRQGLPYPPLGTLYAAALMRQHGYQVGLFDAMLATGPEAAAPFISGAVPDFFVIYDDGFNYLTKMCLTNMREAAFRMCQMAKASGSVVIVSGSDATDHCKNYLDHGADFVLIGEAEQTLLELVTQIKNGNTDRGSILGLAYIRDGEIFKTPARPVMKDLDSLPLPAWDLADMEAYRRMWMKNAGYFSLNMSTTRGCPYKCNWCAKPIYGNRYNSRSPENVVKELKLLKHQYRADHIWFCDDIFGLKPGWARQFAKLLEEEKISIRFKIQSRADLLAYEDTVQALATAGCENVWIGAESGSQKILDAMDKGINLAQIKTATQLMRSHGIKPSFFIQFGYPGEQVEDIRLTIEMINELLPHEIGISVSYPLPGTIFYEKVKAELKKKANWTDSDEMALLFRNTFPASYYKQLHRFVHRNYHKHLASNQVKKLLSDPLKINTGTIKKALSVLYYAPAALVDELRLKKLQKAWE